MKWFEVKEQSAGKKRLAFTWFLYKIFGERLLYTIAFSVAFFTFVFSPKIRSFSKKYFIKTRKYTNLKSSLINQFKHILAYAFALADKILVYAGDFDTKKIEFDSEKDKVQLFNDINKNKGTFFICNHIGNIEVLHSLFADTITNSDCKINIFMSNKQSQIFNEFLSGIKQDFSTKIFQVEDIGLETGVILKENLNKGDMVFIAGDRLSENGSKCIDIKFFEQDISLPVGSFKLAKLMEVPTYLISALRFGKKYKVFIEKQEDLSTKVLSDNFIKFMEKMTLKNPYQFFHFYDFFKE